MNETIWKLLAALELGAALISFFAGVGYMDQYGLEVGGQLLLLGVGFLNAALLTLIVDRLSFRHSGEDKQD